MVNINGVVLFLGAGRDGRGDNSTEAVLRLEEHVRQNPEKFPPGLDRPGGYLQVEPERFVAIAEGLLRMGYSELDVRGIMGENNLRVAAQVWK